MCKRLRSLGDTHRFRVSDSKVVTLTSPGLSEHSSRMLSLTAMHRTGSNGENTRRVDMGFSPSFLKADGAGAMDSKRSREIAIGYTRVRTRVP